jgi:hypothetical protein
VRRPRRSTTLVFRLEAAREPSAAVHDTRLPARDVKRASVKRVTESLYREFVSPEASRPSVPRLADIAWRLGNPWIVDLSLFRLQTTWHIGDLDFGDIRRTPVDLFDKMRGGCLSGDTSRDLGDTTLKIEWRYLSRTTRDELGRDDDGLHR